MSDEPSSMEYVRLNTIELYPHKTLISDETNLHVPFPCLPGEAVEYIGKTVDGVITLSNFRLFIKFSDSFINIPLGLIDLIESRDIFDIHIYGKDTSVVRFSFATNETCLQWFHRLTDASSQKRKLEEMFAFSFYAWYTDGGTVLPHSLSLIKTAYANRSYGFSRTVRRCGFKLGSAWRITHINEEYKVCTSYPMENLVPCDVSDEKLLEVADYRALHRFPSVVWRHERNGAVLVRSSQPEVGWLGWWRNEKDHDLLFAISKACASNPGTAITSKETGTGVAGSVKRMMIVDARSYGAAFANRAKGGGYECAEYYPFCDIQFMNLANIHTVRKSFQALRTLCAAGPDQHNWLSCLETTKWLHYISALIKSTMVVVNAIDKDERPVLVHCSDGWDRTSQIIALAQLIMDPFFRTKEGFQMLVEREWLEFGHKFADRCGHSVRNNDISERCPVFLQWLDCVHQLLQQFPSSFGFNQAYLVKLVQHTYSCMFGTFLCNNMLERSQNRVQDFTFSVWDLLNSRKNSIFSNYIYSTDSEQVLQPSYQMRDMLLWAAVYLKHSSHHHTTSDDQLTTGTAPSWEANRPLKLDTGIQKTRSCDDILAAVEHSPVASRRLSDPSIPLEVVDLFASQYSAVNDENGVGNSNEILDVDDAFEYNRLTSVLNGDYKEINDGGGVLGTNEAVYIAEEVMHNQRDVMNGVSRCNGHCVYEALSSNDDDQAGSVGEPASSSNEATYNHTNGYVSGDDDDDVECDLSTNTNGLGGYHEMCDGESICDKRGSRTNCTSQLNQSYSNNYSVFRATDAELRDGCGVISDTPARLASSVDSDECDRSQHSTCTMTGREARRSVATSTTDISDPRPYVGHHGACENETFSCTVCDGHTMERVSCDGGAGKACGCGRDDCDRGTCHRCRSDVSRLTCGQENVLPTTSGTESDYKTCEVNGDAGYHALSRHLDCDGLSLYTDLVQSRIVQLQCDHAVEVAALQRQLEVMRAVLDQRRCVPKIALPLNTFDGDNEPIECWSNGSDMSWEHLDERESELVRWVPDHTVTHCAACNTSFSVMNRKHHCRNCGRVFCHECSNQSVAVPMQDLHTPARVCTPCFIELRKHENLTIHSDVPTCPLPSEQVT